jgi:hypothetical protein
MNIIHVGKIMVVHGCIGMVEICTFYPQCGAGIDYTELSIF